MDAPTRVITQMIIMILLAGTLYGIFGIAPGTEGFVLAALALLAYATGALVQCVGLPPLVGMLLAGILFKNIRFLPFDTHISKHLSSTLRSVSLVIILLRAGLGLDPEKLRFLGMVVIGLSFIPCMMEAITITLISHLLLELPWLWALLLGFIISAVSAAIIIPGALSLQKQNLGIERGVPTLFLAATSLDNVAALTGFVIIFNILASSENPGWTLLLRHFLEPFFGLLIGAVLGFIFWRFPDSRSRETSVTGYQVTLLLLGGLTLTFLGKRLGASGLGALGCVSVAFVASLRWRKDIVRFESITWIFGTTWKIIEPFLFGLVGAQVTFDNLRSNIGFGTVVILLGVLIRLFSTLLILLRSSLNTKEKFYVALSWISKATVQAAIGSEALDYGRIEDKGSHFEKFGEKILAISVLSILLTAPLGAVLMDILGNRLLKEQLIPQRAPLANQMTSTYGTCSQEQDDIRDIHCASLDESKDKLIP